MNRLLLIDDHTVFRQALAFILNREPDWVVVGEAGSVAEGRRIIAETPIDVAVLDLGLPDGNGMALIREIRQRNPAATILALTASDSRASYVQAVAAGVSAFCQKTIGVDEIINAVSRLTAGETLIDPAVVIQMLREASHHRERDWSAQGRLSQLTRREREVLEALAQGLSDRQIGQRLHVSHETVRTHMANLLGKLGVQSRLQAVLFASRHGAISIELIAQSMPSIGTDS
jgi:DNA-binding NarL/FixJ family response regulator